MFLPVKSLYLPPSKPLSKSMFPACTCEMGAALTDLNEESHFRRHFRVSGDNINIERQCARRFVLKNKTYHLNVGKQHDRTTFRQQNRLRSSADDHRSDQYEPIVEPKGERGAIFQLRMWKTCDF